MRRRDFLGLAAAAALARTSEVASAMASSGAGQAGRVGKPMELGLMVSPFHGPEETIRRVHDLGFTTCFFSLDNYLGKFTPELAYQM